jgi:flagellar protein FlaI
MTNDGEKSSRLGDILKKMRKEESEMGSQPTTPETEVKTPASPDEGASLSSVLERMKAIEAEESPADTEDESIRTILGALAEEEGAEEAEPDLSLDEEPASPEAEARAFSAKKTKWSEKTESEAEKSVVSVEEIVDFTDLVLPQGATFEVEDIHLATSSAFDLVDKGSVLREIDQIWQPGFPGGAPAPAAEPSVVEEEAKAGFLGKLSLFKPKGAKVEEYDPRIHGPLVNLSIASAQGQEEVELYPVNEPYSYIRVIYDNTTHEYQYQVIEPVLNRAEQELLEELDQRLFETLNVNTKGMTRETARAALRGAVDEILHDYGIKLTPVNREKILYHIEKNFLGDGLIDAVMHDKYIEDISCDGLNTPLFVYHTSYESIQTNLIYDDAQKLDSFVSRLAQRAGKYISISDPMLDATMADGSRIQMTLGREVTAHGSTFTIRKFRDEPITPTDLIEWHTFSPLSIAFFWLAVESGKSCIFAGGTASGKTTSLNAISLFIPPLAKIVSLEDTRELKLPHPNWIPSVTRDSFDTGGRGEIDMYELLRAALRQRPEYLLVGEVRGHEALTLFQAMSTGHVTYSTIHADSVASVVHRLENPPLNVPRNMLSALDLVSVQVQARIGGQRIRRNKQLIEILDIDPRTNELITNEVFKWHPSTDEIRYSGKSYILEEIMEDRGWSEARMKEELKRRQEILEWMRLKKLRHYRDVSKVLVSYHRDPEAVMEIVRADLYE